MSIVRRKDVTAMLGELDDDVVTEIIATGTIAEELAEAHAWLASDEPLMNTGRPLPSGRAARWWRSSPPSARRKRRKKSQGGAERQQGASAAPNDEMKFQSAGTFTHSSRR